MRKLAWLLIIFTLIIWLAIARYWTGTGTPVTDSFVNSSKVISVPIETPEVSPEISPTLTASTSAKTATNSATPSPGLVY